MKNKLLIPNLKDYFIKCKSESPYAVLAEAEKKVQSMDGLVEEFAVEINKEYHYFKLQNITLHSGYKMYVYLYEEPAF